MNTTTKNQDMATITVRDIPEELRKRFKLICVQKDRSMNQEIIRLIREYVEQEERQNQGTR
mgnify:CR=1